MLIDKGLAKVTGARGYDKLGLDEWVLAIRVPTAELFSLERLHRNSDTFVLVPDTRAEPDWFESAANTLGSIVRGRAHSHSGPGSGYPQSGQRHARLP